MMVRISFHHRGHGGAQRRDINEVTSVIAGAAMDVVSAWYKTTDKLVSVNLCDLCGEK